MRTRDVALCVAATLLLCTDLCAGVDFLAPNRSVVTGEITPGDDAPVVRLHLARGSVLNVATKGGKLPGGAKLSATFDLLDDVGATQASGTARSTGAKLKKYVVTRTGEHVVRVSASGEGTGTFRAGVTWKAPRGTKLPVSLTAAETAVPFAAEAGSQVVLSLKPARRSTATPQLVRVQTVDGSFVRGLGSAGKQQKSEKITLPETAEYIFVVRSAGEPGDATARVKVRPPRTRPLRTTTNDIGAEAAGVTGTLFGAGVLPGAAPFDAPNGVSVALPEALGKRAVSVFVATAAPFDAPSPELAAISPSVFCGPSGSSFDPPATVTLPATLSGLGGDFDAVEVHTRRADGTVSLVPVASYVFDESAGTVSFETGTFSSFAVFAPALAAEPKFFSSDIALNDRFGIRVAIDGDTAVIGAHTKAGGGAAYVFVRSGARWLQQQRLQAPDTVASDSYGLSVDVDGDRIVVGAPRHAQAGFSAGSAYVWVRSGTTWTLEKELLPRDFDSSPNFGQDVGVSGDTVVVGTFKDDELGFDAGAAYVFTRETGDWPLQSKLTASDGFTQQGFGFSVGIEGDTVAVGATGELSSVLGGVYVYTRSGVTWTERTTVRATSQPRFTGFGNDLALSGGTLVVGAPLDDVDGMNVGAAFVFTGAGGSWTQQARLSPSDALEFGQFGKELDLDGDRVVVGAEAGSTLRAGAAYLFERDTGTWTEVDALSPADGFTGQLFGGGVAVSGTRVLVGATHDNEKGTQAGAVYTFTAD